MRGAVLGFLGFLGCTFVSHALAAAEVEGDEQGPCADLDLTGKGSATYSTNLYREQRRRLDNYDKNAPGQRFHGMEGPEDVIFEAELEGNCSTPLYKKREAGLSLSAGYVFHLKNAIANYFRAGLEAHYDVAKRDRLALEVEVIPERFKQNYSIREVAGDPYFEHAYYREIDAAPSWRHGWTKRLEMTFAYELGVRRYLAPFGNRDTTRHGIELVGSYDFGPAEPYLGAGAALGITPSGLELAVPTDRSYRDLKLLTGVDFVFGAGFTGAIEAEYRRRHYTTDEPLNDAYFDRTDQRWKFGVELKKALGEPFAIFCDLGFEQNETDRHDHPNIPPEDLGYEEWTAGFGLAATL